MSVGNSMKLQEHTAALCRMAALPSGYEISGYEMSRVAKLSGSTSSGFHQEDMRAKLSCSRWMITYPIRIWCPDGKHWLKWASLATAHVPPLSNGVSGHPVRVYSLHGFQRTLLNLRFALVIKKLSKHQNLTHFLLELIARVLNMPIELKGDNYYSKVFKRVN